MAHDLLAKALAERHGGKNMQDEQNITGIPEENTQETETPKEETPKDTTEETAVVKPTTEKSLKMTDDIKARASALHDEGKDIKDIFNTLKAEGFEGKYQNVRGFIKRKEANDAKATPATE